MPILRRISKPFIQSAVVSAAALVLTLGVAAAPAAAGMVPGSLQATGGWYTDDGDFFVGAGYRIGVAQFTVIPNVEYVFVNSGSLYTLNVDGTMNLLPLGIATGYVGVGTGLLIADPDAGDSNTEAVFNLIAGAGLNAIKFKPFAQLKWILVEGSDPLVLAFGVRF